jgi:RsiW-degrading membrane proteinase PrsW (M82 family)
MDPGISPPQAQDAKTLTAEQQRVRWLNVLALIAGTAALVLGLLAGGIFILLSLVGGRVADPLSVTTIGISMAALGAGLGGALAWTGYQGLRGRPSHPFRPGIKWVWICLVGWVLALAVGQAILSFGLMAPVTFPLFHVLGMALPPILIVILVAWGLKDVDPAPTQGQVIGQLAWGAFGTTAIAFSLEAVVAVLGLVLVAVVVAFTPGGLAQITELQALLADPVQLGDPETLAYWLLKPGILLPLALLLVVIAPLIEEAAKSLGVPLLSLGNGLKPTAAQGWLWGVAAGAGFALTEGLFNSAASLPFWAGIALLRVGATAMHVATAGLTGLGWARTIDSRRPLPFLGSFLASVTLHGLWNGMTVLIVVASLWMMARPGDPTRVTAGGLAIVIGLAGLTLLAATIIGVTAYITLRVRRGESRQSDA